MDKNKLMPERECGDKIFVGSGNIYESSCVNSDYFYKKPDTSTYIFTNSNLELFSSIDGIILPIRKKENIKTDITKNEIGVYIVKYYTLYIDSFSNVKDLINYYITYDSNLKIEFKSSLVDFLDEEIKIRNGKPIKIRIIKFISLDKILNEKVVFSNEILIGLGLSSFMDLDRALVSRDLNKITIEIDYLSKTGDNVYLNILDEPIRISPKPNGVVDLLFYTVKKGGHSLVRKNLDIPEISNGIVFKSKNDLIETGHKDMFIKNIGEKYDNYIEEKTTIARDMVSKLVDDTVQIAKLKEAIFKLSTAREEMEIKSNKKDMGELIKIFKVLL